MQNQRTKQWPQTLSKAPLSRQGYTWWKKARRSRWGVKPLGNSAERMTWDHLHLLNLKLWVTRIEAE